MKKNKRKNNNNKRKHTSSMTIGERFTQKEIDEIKKAIKKGKRK